MSQLACGLKPVESRHGDVEYHDVRVETQDGFDGLVAITDRRDDIAGLAQRGRGELQHLHVIVSDDDAPWATVAHSEFLAGASGTLRSIRVPSDGVD